MRAASIAAFALAALGSCADRPAASESAAALSALVAPHVDRIAHFDRWAHRVASAAGAWRTRSALEETAFSQVRTDPLVLGAWIARPGEPTLSYPPETAAPEAPLRTLHEATLGPIEAASARIEHAGAPTDVLLVALDHDGLRTMLALARAP